jgi:hypothetical protein
MLVGWGKKKNGKKIGMMLGVVFQGPGCISKSGKCGYAKIKNGDKIGKNRDSIYNAYTAFRVHFRAVCIHPIKEISLFLTKQ